MATQPKTFITPEEYLQRERAAEQKSGYYRGEIFAMASASEPHALITANLIIQLGSRLRSRDCRVYSNDLRLRVSPAGLYTSPDLMVVCGKPDLVDARRDMITIPEAGWFAKLDPSAEVFLCYR